MTRWRRGPTRRGGAHRAGKAGAAAERVSDGRSCVRQGRKTRSTAEVAAEEAALAAMTESLAAAARDDAVRQERELKYHRSAASGGRDFEGATIKRVCRRAAARGPRAPTSPCPRRSAPRPSTSRRRRRGRSGRSRARARASPPARGGARAPARRRPLPRRTAAYASPRTRAVGLAGRRDDNRWQPRRRRPRRSCDSNAPRSPRPPCGIPVSGASRERPDHRERPESRRSSSSHRRVHGRVGPRTGSGSE